MDYNISASHIYVKAGFKNILEDVSIVCERGEFVGVIGGSGSGKSTLLTSLCGYRSVQRGKVLLNGESIKEKREAQLIGYVPQDDIVHKTLTVERALWYSCHLRSSIQLSEEEAQERIDSVLIDLDLHDHRNKKIARLSGGQRKRVSIAVELLHQPKLFFLDEPTAGLDPALEHSLMKGLKSLSDGGRTILVTTHLMQNVKLFDLIVFIHKGQIIYCGPPEEVTRFFQVSDMIELFEYILPQDPSKLRSYYQGSSLYKEYILNRLKGSLNV